VGLSEVRMTESPDGGLRSVLETAVGERTVPGAALAFGVRDRVLGQFVVGAAELGPAGPRPLTPGTLFDLASLTKVLATAPAVLALHEGGSLSLSDPLGRYVPAFAGPGRDAIRLRHLLMHTAGLRGSRQFHLSCSTPAELVPAVVREPLVGVPGRQVVYSDLGFLLLGEVVAVVTGWSLDQACDALLYRPLGLVHTAFRPADRLPGTPLAATTEPDAEPAAGAPHDRNARLAGGVAGHAGLFSTIGDVAHYAAWWAGDGHGPLSPATRAEAMRCHTAALDGRRGHGWVARGDTADFLDGAWSGAAVTHTGFTGTSIAVDPERGWWLCLLTNAIHLGRHRAEVAALRTLVHHLAAPTLAAATEAAGGRPTDRRS
jgi:CubicO group peptidase (beta-lactamase class C family)